MNGKQYRKIVNSIREKLNYDDATFLLNYLVSIKDGTRKNDFFDDDFLMSILQCFVSGDINLSDSSAKVELNKIIDDVNLLLPLGINTPNYEELKSMIIVSDGHIDKELYSLFENKFNYHQIMHIINKSPIDSRKIVHRFALEIAPLCNSEDELKTQIISFTSALEINDANELYDQRVDYLKRKNGIYSLDEKEVARINQMVRRCEMLLSKLDNMEKRVKLYEEKIDRKVESGSSEISSIVIEAKERMISELNEYLSEIKHSLKDSSDEVFNEILRSAQEKINDIKLVAYNIGQTTTSELIRIQKASEEAKDKLEEYVRNDKNLQRALSSAGRDEKVKQAILSMNSSSDKTTPIIAPAQGVIVPGNDRIVVPYTSDLVIPSKVDRNVIRAFDESIPYSKREEEIFKEKERREKEEGIIYHKMTDEVIKCLIEGDWPYLYGPSGCGKSYLIDQVASLIGLDVIENGKITEKYSIMGYNDAYGRFKATQAFIALVYGKLLSLDEFDNGNPDTQVVLNELYSQLLRTIDDPNKPRHVIFGEDMRVSVNPNFRMISAGNTDGQGRNEVYQARGKIDESVQQRQTQKKINYDNRIEEKILGDYEAWYNIFVNFREVCDEYAHESDLSSTPGMITTRDASAIKKYILHNSKSVDQVIREKFVQNKGEEYLSFIVNRIASIYKISASSEVNPDTMNVCLKDADEKMIAKSLVYTCNRGKRR